MQQEERDMEIVLSLFLTALTLVAVIAASPGTTRRHRHELSVSEIQTRITAERRRARVEVGGCCDR